MRTMADMSLLDLWSAQSQAPVRGWDFAEMADRMQQDEPPWSYPDLARTALVGARSALDMGTGGGELLGSLRDALPVDTLATEGWPPNLPIAAAALEPLGIAVVAYDAESPTADQRRMPFEDSRFDVVLNRHEAYSSREVARVLQPGGVLLTQQVDGRDAAEAHDWFGGSAQPANITHDVLVGQAVRAGLEIEDSGDWRGEYRFDDICSLVRYLHMVPWQAPSDFAVTRYADRLLELHHAGPAHGAPVVMTQRRFWLRAHKPVTAV